MQCERERNHVREVLEKLTEKTGVYLTASQVK